MSKNELPIIPGYRVHKPLGRGGMAAVFLATQESIDREVAIKIMLPELGADSNSGERFIREAKIVARLTHPNIVAIYDVGTAGAYHYISMELLPGGELKDKIGDTGLPLPDALRITRQVAAALHYAHGHGYVHRDVKPENVLFRKDGTAVLSDFGIARAHDVAVTRMTATGAVVGTPYYMSPEQAQGKELDGRSDLYSLGIMFFEMLTGTVPYKGDSALSIGIKHLKDPIPRLPGQFAKYQGLLDKLVAKNPEDRWQTGAEIIVAIETLERGGNVEVDPSLASTQIYEPQPDLAKTLASTRIQTQVSGVGSTATARGPGLAIVFGVLILIVAGGGYWYWQSTSKPSAIPPQTTSTTPTDATDIDRRQKIAGLLKRAQSAERDKRLYGPDDTNATALYKAILGHDRTNSAANAGLLAISQHYVMLAEKAIEQGRLEEAENQLKTAEAVFADNPIIFTRRLALKDAQERVQRQRTQQAAAEQSRQKQLELQQQQAKDAERRRAADLERTRAAATQTAQQEAADRRAREEQLNGLLNKARDYLGPNGLTPTRIALAYDLYREAMKLAPNDNRGSQGLQRVADAYLSMATARAEAKQYDEASSLIQKGLEINPSHNQLLALQKNINEQKNAKKPQRTFGGF